MSVRAVVVSWDGADLLPACLDSLLAQTEPVRVVVVDNASTDGTAELLRDHYPQVHVVRSATNSGFAGGVALGTAGATEEHILLLNNDARLDPDAVSRLLAAMTENDGAVTAKILLEGWYRLVAEAPPGVRGFAVPGGVLVACERSEPGAHRVINSTGNVLTRDGAGGDRDWLRVEGTERGGSQVWGFCGGAALLRRAALEDVGGFDARLFLYYEDTDVSWRMRAAGWTVRYESRAVAHHRHAQSSDAESPLFRFHNTRNSLVVVTRYGPVSMVARAWVRQVLGVVTALVRREPLPVLRARVAGLWAAAAWLPGTLVERRRLGSGARLTRRRAATA